MCSLFSVCNVYFIKTLTIRPRSIFNIVHCNIIAVRPKHFKWFPSLASPLLSKNCTFAFLFILIDLVLIFFCRVDQFSIMLQFCYCLGLVNLLLVLIPSLHLKMSQWLFLNVPVFITKNIQISVYFISNNFQLLQTL